MIQIYFSIKKGFFFFLKKEEANNRPNKTPEEVQIGA
jgi:hypothetical protein